MNKSIYVIDQNRNKDCLDYIKETKIIMIKGIGYFCVSKNCKITPDILFSIACSMEKQNIIEL